jgi:hypothetical protein
MTRIRLKKSALTCRSKMPWISANKLVDQEKN